jgi:hypothetical protein
MGKKLAQIADGGMLGAFQNQPDVGGSQPD